jgi:AraC-like DNA-binding protein
VEPISRNASTSMERGAGVEADVLAADAGLATPLLEQVEDYIEEHLADPDLGPAAIAAARWGFTDAAHFSRLFKSAFGQSPWEYRHVALASAWRPVSSTA